MLMRFEPLDLTFFINSINFSLPFINLKELIYIIVFVDVKKLLILIDQYDKDEFKGL
jgi:hypothetical protein